MKLPEGDLLRSRVVTDLSTTLSDVLDRELTGYALLEPQDALLLDAEGRGVLTFESGVPVVAYHTATDRGGPEALTDLVVPGPYRVELYELGDDVLTSVHDTEAFSIPPGLPARRLAGNVALAERIRAAAPAHLQPTPQEKQDDQLDAVEAFLADEEKIEAIKEQARVQAHRRAERWGLETELSGSQDGSGPDTSSVASDGHWNREGQ